MMGTTTEGGSAFQNMRYFERTIFEEVRTQERHLKQYPSNVVAKQNRIGGMAVEQKMDLADNVNSEGHDRPRNGQSRRKARGETSKNQHKENRVCERTQAVREELGENNEKRKEWNICVLIQLQYKIMTTGKCGLETRTSPVIEIIEMFFFSIGSQQLSDKNCVSQTAYTTTFCSMYR